MTASWGPPPAPAQETDPAADAAAALALLRETRWIKYALHRLTPESYCLVGALYKVQGHPMVTPWAPWLDILGESLRVVEEIIAAEYPVRVACAEPGMIAVTFNNHWATVFADIERVLEKAAAR